MASYIMSMPCVTLLFQNLRLGVAAVLLLSSQTHSGGTGAGMAPVGQDCFTSLSKNRTCEVNKARGGSRHFYRIGGDHSDIL